MDPNATLAALREALADFDQATDADEKEVAGAALANAFEALDGWLSRGGFLPSDWER